MPPTRLNRLLLLVASVALWIAGVWFPAVQFHENPGTASAATIYHSGFDMLFYSALFGWFYGNFSFLANPLTIFGLVFIAQERYRRAIFWLVPAAVLTLQTFQLRLMTWHEDEGGANSSYMTHPTYGWYLWALSILLPLAAAIYWRKSNWRSPLRRLLFRRHRNYYRRVQQREFEM